MALVLTTGIVEVGATEVGSAGLEVGRLEELVGITPVLLLLEGLQLDASGMDDRAAPAAMIPALFRTCRLENLVTRKMSLFPRISLLSVSILFNLLQRHSHYK